MVAIVKKPPEEPSKIIQNDIMKDRVATDKHWFYLFIIIYITWLGSCGYLRYIKDDLEPISSGGCIIDKNETTEQGDFITRSIFNLARIDERTKEHGPIVVYLNIFTYGTLLIFAIFALFFRVYDKYCGHCIMIGFGIEIVSILYRTSVYFNYNSIRNVVPWVDDFLSWVIPEYAAIFSCMVLVLIVILRKGRHAVAENIRKAIGFYWFHWYSLLFGLFTLTLMAILICFTLGMIKGVGVKNITLALPIAILVGSSYLLLLLYYFGVSVISLTTANSYWAQSDQKVSFSDVSRAVLVVSRYHFGTICFNATGILPLIVALFVLLKSVCQTVRSRSSFSKKYIMTAFFFFIGEYSTMITAATGKSFYSATDRIIHLPIEARRVARHLRQSQMIWMIIGLIMISVNNLLIIFNWMLDEDDPYLTQTAIFSYATIIYLFMPIALIIDVVMDTILLCDVEKNEANVYPSREISVELTIDVTVEN